jgi:hypothetical protein
VGGAFLRQLRHRCGLDSVKSLAKLLGVTYGAALLRGGDFESLFSRRRSVAHVAQLNLRCRGRCLKRRHGVMEAPEILLLLLLLLLLLVVVVQRGGLSFVRRRHREAYQALRAGAKEYFGERPAVLRRGTATAESAAPEARRQCSSEHAASQVTPLGGLVVQNTVALHGTLCLDRTCACDE